MAAKRVSEEEVEQVLKTLFAEKHKVKELQKKLAEASDGSELAKKFQEKLSNELAVERSEFERKLAEKERVIAGIETKLIATQRLYEKQSETFQKSEEEVHRLQVQLAEVDPVALEERYRAEIDKLQLKIQEVRGEHREEIRELQEQHAEALQRQKLEAEKIFSQLNGEMRKAQQHLAKKVKEAEQLRQVLERKQVEIVEREQQT